MTPIWKLHSIWFRAGAVVEFGGNMKKLNAFEYQNRAKRKTAVRIIGGSPLNFSVFSVVQYISVELSHILTTAPGRHLT